MNLSKFKKIEYGFLRSKVARRIFFLFIFCALLPLSALAYFSFGQVTKQLYHQAEQRLHQESKSAGMTTIERLMFLETDLKLIIANLKIEANDSLESATHEFRERLKARFKGLVIVSGNDRTGTSPGIMQILSRLSYDEQQHINAGMTLVKVRPNADKFASIFMVRALDPAQPSKRLLIGEILQSYLWGSEKFLPPLTEIFILDENKNVLFSSFPEYFPLREIKNAMQKRSTSKQFTWKNDDDTYLASYWTSFMRPLFFVNWIHVHSQSKADILRPLNNFKKIFILIVILTFFVVLFLSFSQIRKNLVPIELLQKATQKIAGKNFKSKVKIKSNDEFEELGASFNYMTDSLEKHLNIMETINSVGIALSAEKDTNRLMETILQGAKNIVNADGGILYTITEDQQLKLSVMRIDSLHHAAVSTNNVSIIPLYDKFGKPNTKMVAAYSVVNGATINIPNIYTADGFDFSGNFNFDRETGYRSQSFLSVPLKNHENDIIGVLQLINAQNTLSKEIVPFTIEDLQITETLTSQAAIALTKNKLVEDFKRLFDSMIELIAMAIDAKSEYTGSHCRRVPDLTMLLAEAVCNKKDGPFKDFNLSEQELYELKVSALLHDCGKVTTPVHIVDKATKLESIYDRIHLIDTRFELLKRDLQIAVLRKKLSVLKKGDEIDFSELENEINKQMLQVDEDRDFLHVCNKGRKVMCEKSQARVKEIAHKYRWVNSKGAEKYILSEDEIYNLTIPTGTLTPKERNIVNYHVTVTAKMLESLSYPKSLSNVPKYAKVHHERMDGSGYPDGLTRDQIPVQGRILAIADIFEALTARDRPYKKRKILLEALRILDSMKQNGHIDPDLFDVFISEKVYLNYAKKYLLPDQIDEVEPSDIPGFVPQHNQ